MKDILSLTATSIFFLLIGSLPVARANDVILNHWGQFTFENDAFGVLNTSDDGYTNGVE